MKKILLLLVLGILILNGIGAGALHSIKTQDEQMRISFPQSKIQKKDFQQLNVGEITWIKHKIDVDFEALAGVYTCDLDGDGDKDVLGASIELDEIAWWCNEGGNPIVWTKQTIDNYFDGAAYVFAYDLDGDGDSDVLGAAWFDNEIACWRNNGGDPIIWTKQIIKTNYDNAHEVYACDMDNDRDIDVFGASAGLNEVTWWRNDGGNPINWTEQKIGDCYGARSVYVSDVNGDGNNDVIGAAFTSNEVIWWRNDGEDPIQWTEFDIDSSFSGAHHVSSYDIDGDGDYDVIGASALGNEVTCWRNEGGDPIIWTKEIIDDNFRGALKISIADLDDDNDLDIIGTAVNANRISWWRNDGEDPIIWTKKTIDMMCPGAWPLHVDDIDNDGDVDVIGGGTSGISWYENSLYSDSDLECEGSIKWNDVKPGSTVIGSFTVENLGKSYSLLAWEISEYPDWGTWIFNPEDGEDLTPEDGKITVEISVVSPDDINQVFNGEIKIVNKDASGDYCILSVSLATPKNKPCNSILYLLNRIVEQCPLLKYLIDLGFAQ